MQGMLAGLMIKRRFDGPILSNDSSSELSSSAIIYWKYHLIELLDTKGRESSEKKNMYTYILRKC